MKNVKQIKEKAKGIAEKICDLTGYGLELHPNDILQYLVMLYKLAIAERDRNIIEMIEKQDWECFEQEVIKKDIINLINSKKYPEIVIHKECNTKSNKGEYEDGVIDYLCPTCAVTFLDDTDCTMG